MWDWAVWGTLALGAVAVLGASALLAVRALTGWRDVKRLRRGLSAGLGELAAKGEATEAKVALVADTAELRERLARLHGSLARLAVLRAALDEAEETLGRLIAFVPRR